MRVEIVYKESFRPPITINDVYSIESTTFTVSLRQLTRSFMFHTLTFDLLEIKEINILKL